MLRRVKNLVALITIGLVIINCANRGTPTGGDRDEDPPIITKSSPENFSTNFNSKEIKIYFDEYIKIQDLQRNLIISPPMDPEPEITPLGTASKYITIKIHDTLRLNTTYALNFGESIVDNNEGNPYPFFRYVFSTGDYIDSLSVGGSISDALNRIPEEFVTVMLYEVDSSFTDSIVYKKKPNYITNSLDSTATFNLENLKDGKYLMVALKDKNNNYTFEPKSDKIGFVDDYINVPTDSSYTIELFNEQIDFKATRPFLLSGQKIGFGYEGTHEDMQIKLLSSVPDGFKNVITKDQKRDTLFYWYKPKVELDSMLFEISNLNYIDTLTVRLNNQVIDSLSISPRQTGVLPFNTDFEIEGNVPIESIDENQISILDKDTLQVDFTTSLDTLMNRLKFDFEKTESNTYQISLLPGALTDFFETTNDTTSFSLKTRTYADYGNVRITLQNAVYPVILQLVDEQDEIEAELYSTEPETLDFENVPPKKYYLRVIYDTNGNGKYDPGSYLKKYQSERVSYYPDILDVRASWNLIQEFILKD
jgi:uncharacterized protein (DUF2141 family)